MIAYGHRSFPLHLPSFLVAFERRLDALASQPSLDSLTAVLVDFAEAESAVTDALMPDRDDEHHLAPRWHAALDVVSAAFCASLDEDDAGVLEHLQRLKHSLASLHGCWCHTTVSARIAEGFSCYALYPDQYVDAATLLAERRQGRPVFSLGLRSVGSVLAAVVTATLRRRGVEAWRRSVRPRGHPFDRRIVLGSGLAALLREHSTALFAIVDEGPGISGSSFAAAAEALLDLGIPADQIAIVPAWQPDVSALRSESARRAFMRHAVVVGRSPAERLAAAAVARASPVLTTAHAPATMNISAGRWRSLVAQTREHQWPAVHPQHERVKVVNDSAAPSAVARFAGLGRHGWSKAERADALHAGGFGPRPLGLHRGMLCLSWIDGTLMLSGQPDVAALDRIADYLAFLARTFPTTDLDDRSDLRDMLRQNAIEGLGPEQAAPIQRLADDQSTPYEGRVALDGRMLAHEWIDDGQQRVKVDALDHHADDFLPGCRDIAWDLAGTCIEMRLSSAARRRLLERYRQCTSDATIEQRLPFFAAAYLAYRLGYAALAAGSLAGTPDGERFTRLRERYRRLLAAHAVHPLRAAAR